MQNLDEFQGAKINGYPEELAVIYPCETDHWFIAGVENHELQWTIAPNCTAEPSLEGPPGVGLVIFHQCTRKKARTQLINSVAKDFCLQITPASPRASILEPHSDVHNPQKILISLMLRRSFGQLQAPAIPQLDC